MRSPAANRRMLTNSLHHLPPGSVAKRRTNPNRWIEMTLGVRRRADCPTSPRSTGKPGDRTYMTRDQLRTSTAPTRPRSRQIKTFAQAHHLIVTRNEPMSARLDLGGTVANVSARVRCHPARLQPPQLGQFHARTGTVCCRRRLRDVTGVFGLSNQRVMHRLPRRRQVALADAATLAGAALVHPDRPRRHL